MHPIAGRNPAIFDLVNDPIINEPDGAKYLGVSLATIRRLRRAGKIAYVQISDKRLGYRRSTLNRLLDDRTVPPTAA
jgi:predicted site-specific integrase-resolvase